MAGGWRQECNRLGLVVILAVGGALASVVDHVSAQQVASDATLPQNSTVTSINNNFTITAGTQVGQVTLISHASGATPERLGTATTCIQP
jgi:large exoprotein involved in heme utilization and adhesion